MPANLTLVIESPNVNKLAISNDPIWSKIVKRAAVKPLSASSITPILFALFNLVNKEHLPVAPILAFADNLAVANEWWLCADPVELRADASNVHFLGNDHLQLTVDEITALAKEINAFLAKDNLQLIANNPHHWYIKLKNNPDIITYEPNTIIGKNIYNFFPSGKHAQYWRMLLTELQMLLFNSKINLQRANQGLPQVNSLWFWGQGQLPQATVTAPWQQVWTNHTLTHGLALLTKSHVQSLPVNCSSIMALPLIHNANYLIVIDTMQLNESDSDICQNLVVNWIAPIVKAMRNQMIQKLTIYESNKVSYYLSGKQLLPWWKKIIPFNVK